MNINIIEIVTILAGITGLLTLFNFSFNKRIDDLSNTFNKRIDDLSNTFNKRIDDLKELFKTELNPIKENLDNHITETDKKIDSLKEDIAGLKMDVHSVLNTSKNN